MPTNDDEDFSAQSLFHVVSSYPQLLHHEDSIAKTPHNVSAWIMYVDQVDELMAHINMNINANAKFMSTTKTNGAKDKEDLMKVRDWTGRRAVHYLPKSYKLWKSHWEFCTYHNVGHRTKMWERALVTLNKFPRVWMEYLSYAHDVSSMTPTQLRHLANRALEALPVTQHDKIWPVLVKYYLSTSTSVTAQQQQQQHVQPIPKETKLSMLRRYIQFSPAATQEVADFLADELGHWGEAALLYVKLLNQPEITSLQRKDLWMALAKICTRNPVEQVGLDWEAMVRAVLANKNYLPAELHGIVWNQLADAWIRRGEFQLARSVYEEALESVSKVRDFTILLDAYLQFEEGLLEATMEAQPDDEEEEENDETKEVVDENDWDLLIPTQCGTGAGEANANTNANTTTSSMSDLELALARAEDLTARRPILLNRVLLRQNPHDVGEWLKRARLYKENDQLSQAAVALEDALQTVHARRAVGGSPSQIVLDLVQLYEGELKDVTKARDLLDRICNQWVYEFKTTDDLAECHAAWIELELRQDAWDDALEIIRRSVVVPPKAPKMVKGLAKSLRLWDLLLDLEESLGTVQTTKDAYSRAIEQRVATPLHILNYATFLTGHKYFEESFSAYERGIELFEFPGVKVIWKGYIDAFLKRYGGSKLERTRDLFQRCIEACPPEECSELFLLNGTFEEEHGLTKRALGVYRDMCKKVPAEEKYTSYQLFIAKTTKYLGQTATRDIYQSAIEDLDDNAAARVCLEFAKMETSMQEMDRARAVLTYGAQMADPRRNEDYWKDWNQFEIAHGNEETFREMLRIKRSVEASFSTVNYNAAEMSQTSAKVETLSNDEAMQMIARQEGVDLEPQIKPMDGFVSAKRTSQDANLDDVEERVAKLRKATAMEANTSKADEAATNDDDDEIDIDDLEGGEEEEEPPKGPAAVQDVSTKAVPAAVFGGLAELAGDGKREESVGALERLRAAKAKDRN
jgi:pre-mRNA-splicing factor SYF1